MYRPKRMSLWHMRHLLKGTARYASTSKSPHVLFYVGDTEYVIESMGQDSVVPDVTITLVPTFEEG